MTRGGPRIVTDGLVLCLDANSKRSYPGSGNTWYDSSENSYLFTLGNNLTFSNNSFLLSDSSSTGATTSSSITTSTTCTLVFWIKTTDTVGLFWGTGAYFVGAYSSSNKEYHGNSGTPDYYQDLEEKTNIYDNIRDGNWHMVEFKNVNFSTWTNQHYFNSYTSGFAFNNGECSKILVYNKNLSAAESLQNYNAHKSRFGL